MMSAAVQTVPRREHLRIAAVLALAGTIAVLLLMPYLLAAMPALAAQVRPQLPLFVFAQTVQSGLLFLLLAWAGLRLGAPHGLDAPLLRHTLCGTPAPTQTQWRVALLLGASVAGLCILLLRLMPQPLPASPAWWQGLLASFYGGIGEEVICRLFLVSALLWLVARLTRSAAPSRALYIVAIVLAAVLFGIGHLPALAALGTASLTFANIVYVVGLNALCGCAFGWLFWRYGLEHAMVAHFSADLVLHVAAPLL